LKAETFIERKILVGRHFPEREYVLLTWKSTEHGGGSTDHLVGEVAYSSLNCDSEIRLKFECIAPDLKYKSLQSEVREDREPVSEISALELKLDNDEIEELHTMCTPATVRIYITQLIAQLETLRS
jgi:hypothetical protein